MKVLITATPEYPIGHLNEIVSLLQNTPGELEFNLGKPLTFRQYRRTNPIFNNTEITQSLTFQEYYDLCDTYRDIKEVPDDEFVVMITSILNCDHWYSAYEGKNIFVYSKGWGEISEADSKFGMSYQVVENVFQSLLKLNIRDLGSEPNIHYPHKGCINDYSKYPEDLFKKLRIADICKSCTEKAIAMNVSSKIIIQISVITEVIRNAFINKIRIQPIITPEKVYIDKDANITIGEKTIELNPLQTVIFIFFLKNPEGITTKQFCDRKNDFQDIYQLISTKIDKNTIARMCCKTRKGGDPTFKIYKSTLNTLLKAVLGEPLAKYYTIEKTVIGKGNNLFKINISHDYLNIDPRF